MTILVNCKSCGQPKEIKKGVYNYQTSLGKTDFYHKECFTKKAYYQYGIKIHK